MFLRAAYEGKMNTVVELLNQGVPIDASNQVCSIFKIENIEIHIYSNKTNLISNSFSDGTTGDTFCLQDV